jgi:hypothetical protein
VSQITQPPHVRLLLLMLPRASAAACPQLAEADIRALAERSGFDPQQTSGVQCNRLTSKLDLCRGPNAIRSLKRREFISLLAGVALPPKALPLIACRWRVNVLHSSSVLTVVALAARAEFLFRIALIELA